VLYQCQLAISRQNAGMWHFIVSFDAIPDDRDLAIAVVDKDGFHPLEIRCRCKDGCWIDVTTGRLIEVHPTHWQDWPTGI
jgi:hypothetical protein